MEIRVSGSRNAKKVLLEAANGLGNLKEVRHTNNHLNNGYDRLNSRTVFVFEEEEITVFDSFTNGYKGVGPNCLCESLVQLGVDEAKAGELAYDTDKEFTLTL